ncbi:MAG TPA: hypothetical protein GXX18_02575 [Bacillales bacterium]|nr:hypothetical protein [Bacillales bacterium]
MRTRKIFLVLLLFSMLFLYSCSEKVKKDENNVEYQDDKMLGFVEKIYSEKDLIVVNINEWYHRDIPKDEDTVIASNIITEVKTNDNTVFRYENGTKAVFETLKIGQKVLVTPPISQKKKNVLAMEIVLLDLSYHEKLRDFLSNDTNKLRVSIIQDAENPLSYDSEGMSDLISQEPTLNFHDYQKDFVVDYKKEFDIEKLPVILIFDTEKLLFKTYNLKDATDFIREWKK